RMRQTRSKRDCSSDVCSSDIITEEPFSAKYSRSNQSGQVCYCMFGTDEANQKTKDGWQKIKCLGINCQYRQKKQVGPPDCKKIRSEERREGKERRDKRERRMH